MELGVRPEVSKWRVARWASNPRLTPVWRDASRLPHPGCGLGSGTHPKSVVPGLCRLTQHFRGAQFSAVDRHFLRSQQTIR